MKLGPFASAVAVAFLLAVTVSLSATAQEQSTKPHCAVSASVFEQSQQLTNDGGPGPSRQGVLPNAIMEIDLADAFTLGAFGSFQVPRNVKPERPLLASPVWNPSFTDSSSHSVVWSMDALVLSAGVDVTAAGTTTQWIGDSSPKVANQTQIETAVPILSSVRPGDVVRFDLRRLGSDRNDSYFGNAHLMGIDFREGPNDRLGCG